MSDKTLQLLQNEPDDVPGSSTEKAWAELDRLIHAPDSPERQQAMAAAMTDPGELGRLTRKYLLTVANLAHGGAQ